MPLHGANRGLRRSERINPSHATHGQPVGSILIAVVGTTLQCGVATFTTDLCNAKAAEHGAGGAPVVAINDPQSSYTYPKIGFGRREGKELFLVVRSFS